MLCKDLIMFPVFRITFSKYTKLKRKNQGILYILDKYMY